MIRSKLELKYITIFEETNKLMKMKKLFTLLLFPFVMVAQVTDFSNIKKEKAVIPYDSTYIQVDYSTTEEMKKGLIGQDITVLKTSYVYVLDFLTKKNIKYDEVNKLEGIVFTIKDFIKDGYRKYYHISNESGEYLFEDSSSNKFIINSYINSFKENYLGKSYVPLKNELEIESLNTEKHILKGTDSITVTDIQYAKISRVEYSMVFIFNNGLMSKFGLESYSQPNEIGWIKLGGQFGADVFIGTEVLEQFKTENKGFIDEIRSGKIKIGMTKRQCTLAWGSYNESYKNILDYDIVLEYGTTGNSQALYFKNGKLELIK